MVERCRERLSHHVSEVHRTVDTLDVVKPKKAALLCGGYRNLLQIRTFEVWLCMTLTAIQRGVVVVNPIISASCVFLRGLVDMHCFQETLRRILRFQLFEIGFRRAPPPWLLA